MSAYLDDCVREQFLRAVERKMREIGAFGHVVRRKCGYNELTNFAQSQFPVLAITGSLPVPKGKRSGREPGVDDVYVSSVSAHCWIYLRGGDDADEFVSEFAQRTWAKLHETPRWGRTDVIGSEYEFGDPEFRHPYAAFRVTVTIEYVHGTGGI